MNEKREIRKEILLLPSEFEQFTAAANASGLPLTAWLVQAAREKLARDGAGPKWSDTEKATASSSTERPKIFVTTNKYGLSIQYLLMLKTEVFNSDT